MSAYMVSNDTLDLLVTVACWNRRDGMIVVVPNNVKIPQGFVGHVQEHITVVNVRYDDANLIKKVLHDQNVRSLVARYGDNPEDYTMERFNFVEATRNDELFKKIFGATRCYEYQACESDDYHVTFAHHVIQAIAKRAMAEFSEGYWQYHRKSILTV